MYWNQLGDRNADADIQSTPGICFEKVQMLRLDWPWNSRRRRGPGRELLQ